MQSNYVSKTIDTPVGTLTLVASQQGRLTAISWKNDHGQSADSDQMKENSNNQVLLETERQLKEYFEGARQVFSLDLDFNGTEFQNLVWKALLSIPFGETRSYGDIARQIGSPNAVRAVGAANGKNPIPIVVPCHRVIGTSGKLVGFGGGLENKSILLGLEKVKTGKQKQISLF